MALDPRFMTVCRMAGLTEHSSYESRAELALPRAGSGVTVAESASLVQIIRMVIEDPTKWGLIQGAFAKMVADRPALMPYYTVGETTSAAVALLRKNGQGKESKH